MFKKTLFLRLDYGALYMPSGQCIVCNKFDPHPHPTLSKRTKHCDLRETAIIYSGTIQGNINILY